MHPKHHPLHLTPTEQDLVSLAFSRKAVTDLETWDLPKIQSLSLADCPILKEDPQTGLWSYAEPISAGCLSNLTYLDIRHTLSPHIECERFWMRLRNLTKLEWLDVSFNRMDFHMFADLVNNELPLSLRSLSARVNNIHKGFDIDHPLRFPSTLQMLNVSCNCLSVLQIMAIDSLIPPGCCLVDS